MFEDLQHPRQWTPEFGWIASIPLRLLENHYPFSVIQNVPPAEEVVTGDYYSEVEERYLERKMRTVPPNTMVTWALFERQIYAAVFALRKLFSPMMMLPFLPWGYGYQEKHKTVYACRKAA
ncbi:hypothetical protein FA15DRAFT_658430 [Coprinopsis marcescibilis]|uniref:Uncharacterized protein n=1 Tax=Coprinopsis marcescibilis TaxID=230819 RepID=A0A5C3KLW4_COPMA|nr:hypothetical protein FA15DRAFT_658430 [Coprinopsis marcescibilis]